MFTNTAIMTSATLNVLKCITYRFSKIIKIMKRAKNRIEEGPLKAHYVVGHLLRNNTLLLYCITIFSQHIDVTFC